MTLVAHEIVVDRPISEVYDEWRDGPSLSRRLGDIVVEPIAEHTTRWTVPLGTTRHEVVVREIHTSSRTEVVWMSLAGPRLAGRLTLRPLGSGSTCVRLSVDFDPRNPLGWLAESFGVPDRAVERILDRFKVSVDDENASQQGI